jgi:hypothetical protein
MQFDPREEGITHINIYSKSNSTIGRVLSNWIPCTIETSIGEFRSIEGLIYYLGSFVEQLRGMVGYDAKKFGEKCDRGIRLPEDIFRRIIIEGMESKLEHINRNILKEFINSDLPLTHYYCYDGKVVEIPKWQWQVEEWEKIRKRLRNDLSQDESI